MIKYREPTRWALRLLLAAGVLMVVVFGCRQVVVPPGGEDDGGWYMDLSISSPVTPRLITVTEYPVTHLVVEVTDPTGQVIQVIMWEASEGPKRYRVPVTMEGPHEVVVTHISKTEANYVEASESAVFHIQVMIITEVNVIPGAIGFINILAPEQEARNIARMEVLPRILEETKTERYSMLGLLEALPAGTLIEPDAPIGDQRREAQYTLEEDGYLFFLDLEPGAYFEHATMFIIITRSGKVEVFESGWWPRVDGRAPEPFVADVPLRKYVVQRNVEILRRQVTAIDWRIIPGTIELLKREAFLCVQGLTPTESLYGDAVATYVNGYNFFDAYKSSTSTLVGIASYEAAYVLDKIQSLAEDGHKIITIYIIAHGNVDVVRLGGIHIYASQFASTMSSLSSVEFNFLLGSCRSGSFINNLSVLPNVRVVETACLGSESAYGDVDYVGSYTDYNVADTGSEWTSSILRAAERIVVSATLWSIVTSQATTYGVSKTSVLLSEAGYLGVGLSSGLPTYLMNYDLSNRVGWSTPDRYRSW